MTRKEKIKIVIDELSMGEYDGVSQELIDMVQERSERGLDLLINQIHEEKEWLCQVGDLCDELHPND